MLLSQSKFPSRHYDMRKIMSILSKVYLCTLNMNHIISFWLFFPWYIPLWIPQEVYQWLLSWKQQKTRVKCKHQNHSFTRRRCLDGCFANWYGRINIQPKIQAIWSTSYINGIFKTEWHKALQLNQIPTTQALFTNPNYVFTFITKYKLYQHVTGSVQCFVFVFVYTR